MDVAILLNQRDAELFLSRPRQVKTNIIAGGVDTFAYLEKQNIPFQRLTKYFRLQQTKTEWKRARTISSRFLKQSRITALYKKDIDYRYPIHQLLKYLLTDIVRNQAVVERILTKNKPVICYISNTLTEPLVQKLHNQEFTLFNHVLIQLCKQRNIQVRLIQNRQYFHYLRLLEIISRLLVETVINATRSIMTRASQLSLRGAERRGNLTKDSHARSSTSLGMTAVRSSCMKRNFFRGNFDRSKQTVLFSASNHQLTNTRRLIDRLRQRWNVIVVGKLKKTEEMRYTQGDVMFVPLNTLIRYLSFTDLFSTLLLTGQIFIGFLLLPKKLKQQHFDKALGGSLWNLLGPSLGLYSSLLIYEISLYSKYIEQLWRTAPFNFVLASNNIDPFHFALLSFARRHSIPYALLVHDAQGNTFCDFFFKSNDTLLVWGNFQKRIMEKDFPRLDCIVTGHPNFDNIVTLSKENQPISRLILKKRLKILVLSTYNPYIQFPNQEVLFDVFGELDKIKKYKISVTLKSHPSENHARLVQLTQNFIRYPLRWSQENAETLLQKHDLIITQSTSAGFWAILLHKPTIYLNIHELKDYEPYAKTGAALGVYYLHQLNPTIEALIKYPRLCEKNQTIFIKDFCYKLNEEASLRIYKYIQTNMNSL